jgi:hypothetical protein
LETQSALKRIPTVRERLVLWVIEMIIQVFAFSLLMLWIGHEDRPVGLGDIVVGCYAVLYIFGLSGYLITTLIARVFLMRQSLWLSPVWAAALFLIHFEVLNRLILPGGAAGPRDRVDLRLEGVCITCLTALAGSIALRRKRRPQKTIQSLF